MPMHDRTYKSANEARVAEMIRSREVLDRSIIELGNEGEPLVYPTQEIVANEIANRFLYGNMLIATLCAAMQWGKTGVLLQVAYILTTHISKSIPTEQVYVITGMCDNEWTEQTQERMGKFKVIHRGKLKKRLPEFRKLRNALIIIDECHFAAAKKSTLGTLLKSAGLLDIQNLKSRNIRILQTSATPDNVLANAEKWNNGDVYYHYKCVPKNPPTYTSPHDIKEDGRLVEMVNLSNVDECETFIQNMGKFSRPKYHIIRLPSKTKSSSIVTDNFKSLSAKYDLAFLEHNCKSPLENAVKTLSTLPPKNTIIFVKNMWRAAKTLPDIHLGLLHEAPGRRSPSNSAESQSFVGRCCGHNKIRGPAFEAPVIYCNMKSINNYIKLMQEVYDYKASCLEYEAANLRKKKDCNKPRVKPSWAVASNITGIEVAEEVQEKEDTFVKTFHSFEELKKFAKKKWPEMRPRARRTNKDGFFLGTIRTTKNQVLPYDFVVSNKGWGTQSNKRIYACYRDVNDKSTLVFCICYKETMSAQQQTLTPAQPVAVVVD